MAQFKKMKMRINNPDHSKAVQEWLFDQGYAWFQRNNNTVQYPNRPYLYTTGGGELRCGSGGHWTEESFVRDCRGEVDVQHLDPHLYPTQKATCVPAKTFTEKPKAKPEFEKLSTQLKQLDKAIDSHENKQNKRKKDRERVIQKMESMLPEGYSLVFSLDVRLGDEAEFYPTEVIEGSIWECVDDDGDCHLTVGKEYKVLYLDEDNDPGFENDVGSDVWLKEDFLASFKRVA